MELARPALFLALTSLTSLAASMPAHACATAPPEGASVTIAQETALIVWDEATKTEHFVRRAVFRTQANDFGFLVPTPTRPELAPASDDVFDRLEQMVLPEIRYEEPWSGVDFMPVAFFLLARSADKSAASAVAPVRVLEEKRVGSFDAAVLEADDADALASWLREHGYAERPALTEWLAPYVARHWIVTAFKIGEGATQDAGPSDDVAALVPPRHLGSESVRLSFRTDKPFFPYREPADQRGGSSRSFRVFHVAPHRVDATIGDGTTPFPGKTSWAAPLDVARASLPVAVPPGAWLTAFEDDASPRPGVDELWFTRSSDTAMVKPPPVVVRRPRELPFPLDLVLGAGALGFVLLRRRRGRGRGR